jgi:hypothetical protein
VLRKLSDCAVLRVVVKAQQPADPPPAPVPAQIFTGKKAFISKASGEGINPPGSADLNYNQFYASMKSWGRYELVAAPRMRIWCLRSGTKGPSDR